MTRGLVPVVVVVVLLSGCSLPFHGPLSGGPGPEFDRAAAQRHAQALESAGSYTAVVELEHEVLGETPLVGNASVTRRLAVERDRGRRYRSVEVSGGGSFGVPVVDGEVEKYTEGAGTADSVTYRRERVGDRSDGGPRLYEGVAPYRNTNGSAVEPVRTSLLSMRTLLNETTDGSPVLRRTGTRTVDGEQVTVYRRETEDVVHLLRPYVGKTGTDLPVGEGIETAVVTLRQREDGVVSHLNITYTYVLVEASETGDDEGPVLGRFTLHHTVSDVGATTVARPDWYDTARAEAVRPFPGGGVDPVAMTFRAPDGSHAYAFYFSDGARGRYDQPAFDPLFDAVRVRRGGETVVTLRNATRTPRNGTVIAGVEPGSTVAFDVKFDGRWRTVHRDTVAYDREPWSNLTVHDQSYTFENGRVETVTLVVGAASGTSVTIPDDTNVHVAGSREMATFLHADPDGPHRLAAGERVELTIDLGDSRVALEPGDTALLQFEQDDGPYAKSVRLQVPEATDDGG